MKPRSIKFLLPVAAIACVLVAISLVVNGDGAGRKVSFVVAQATTLREGLKVRAAGQQVGKISSLELVNGGRAARVELELTDEKVWPLPSDTRIRVRYGGTVSYAQRYVDLRRGTAGGPIPEGGTLSSANVEFPVEFDEVFGTFDRRTRRDLGAALDTMGAALPPASPELRGALEPAGDLTEQGKGLFGDLGQHPSRLVDLVRSSDRVLRAARAANPGVAPLLDDAAITFTATAGRASELERLLHELPASLDAARGTLARADRTLVAATGLSRDLRPGVDRLIRITAPLNRTLATLTSVAPDARATLAVARRAAPDIRGLLDRGRAALPELRSIAEQGRPQVRCIRPFAPEIAGWASTWTGFLSEADGKDKYARLYNSVYPFPNDTPFGTGAASKIFPGAFRSYAFPRPPGANVGQPWFQPDCHITPDGLDPTKNPEDVPDDPLSKKLVEPTP